MNIDPVIVVAGAIIITVVLWPIPIVLGRVDGRVTARGFRNGSIIAAGIFLVITTLVTILFYGGSFGLVTLDFQGALLQGAFVGLIFALGYIWLGALLIAVGLIFRSKPAWTTLGAWAAVPVVVVSAGFGYVSFRSVQQEGAQPPRYSGTIAMQLTGAQLGQVEASGNAICQLDDAGNLRLQAGGGVGSTTLATRDGRLTTVQFDLDANAVNASINLTVGPVQALPGQGWEASPHTIAVGAGSTSSAGQATLAGLVPLSQNGEPNPADTWQGQLSWTCSSRQLPS